MLILSLLLTLWIVRSPTILCETTIAEIPVYRVSSYQADTLCGAGMMGKVLDNGTPYNPAYHRILGCFIVTPDGKALIIYNGEWRVLNHELDHARTYFCK